MSPKISVLMAVLNGEKFLCEAIESIIDQTYDDFEFIIVNDGSTDASEEIIQSYHNKDSRIKTLKNDENIGLAGSLNLGIQHTDGKYIARMDADDVSMPERFEKQIFYLDENPDIQVLGTNVFRINENGIILREVAYPTLSKDMRWNMIWGNNAVVCHPTVMMRTQWIRDIGLYKDQQTSQDLELWSRVFNEEPLPIYNLQIPLLKYREHPTSISKGASLRQFQISNQTRMETINRNFNRSYTSKMVDAFRTINPNEIQYIKEELPEFIRSWFEVLALFQQRFLLTSAEIRDYYEQTLQRTRTYVSLNPLSLFRSQQIWLPTLIEVLDWKDWWNLLLYKLKWVFRKKHG